MMYPRWSAPWPATLFPLLALPTSLSAQRFVSDVDIVEVARVVGPDELNGHFISQSRSARLLDSTTIAYVETLGTRRLTVANLRTGDGWEVIAGRGVLSDLHPMSLHGEVFIRGDTLTVVTGEGDYLSFSRSGEVLGRSNIDAPIKTDSLGGQYLSGITSQGVPVYHYFELPPGLSSGSHRVPQGIRVGDQRHPLEELQVEVWADQHGRRSQSSPPTHSTRGDLIAYAIPGSHEVTLMSGATQTTIDVGWPVEAERIDGSGRTWVRLHQIPVEGDGYGWLVLDSRGAELMRVVPPRHFVDAFQDWMLTQEYSEPDTLEWALYRIRER